MARTRRIRRDGDAHYHLMSRTNDRRFLFSKGRVKGEIVSLLRRAAEFSGVRLEAWCVMDDHFHVVCEVGRPGEPVPEAEVLRRIGVLKGGRFAAELAGHWFAKNVVGVKIPVTQVHNGSTYVANIDVIGVPADYNGEYTWDFNYVDGVNFQRPADDLTPDATTTGISDNEKDGDITTYTQRGKNYNAYVWTFEKAKDITAIGLFSNTADSNNRSFSVGSVSVKHKGEADYTELPGIAFDYFNRGSNILSCVLRPTNKYIARDVTSLKVALGDKQSNWVPSFMAEVYCTGRDSVHGLMLLIR